MRKYNCNNCSNYKTPTSDDLCPDCGAELDIGNSIDEMPAMFGKLKATSPVTRKVPINKGDISPMNPSADIHTIFDSFKIGDTFTINTNFDRIYSKEDFAKTFTLSEKFIKDFSNVKGRPRLMIIFYFEEDNDPHIYYHFIKKEN